MSYLFVSYLSSSLAPCSKSCASLTPFPTKMRRDKLTVKTRLYFQLLPMKRGKFQEFLTNVTITMSHLLREVEEEGQVPAIGQLGAGLPQLVKECVGTGLQWGDPGRGGVLQQSGHQVYGLGTSPCSEHLKNMLYHVVVMVGCVPWAMGGL